MMTAASGSSHAAMRREERDDLEPRGVRRGDRRIDEQVADDEQDHHRRDHALDLLLKAVLQVEHPEPVADDTGTISRRYATMCS